MTTGDELLRAILDSPEDDALRLVYADWLEEQGQADRAEFIRVQCELEEIRPGPDEHIKASNLLRRYRKGAPVRLKARTPATLLVRETILLDSNRFLWSNPLPQISGHTWSDEDGPWDWKFRRGFVEEITCPWADWQQHADIILQAQPVRKVNLTTAPKELLAIRWPKIHFYFVGDK